MKGKIKRKIFFIYIASFFILLSCSQPFNQSDLNNNRNLDSATNRILVDNQRLPVEPIDDDFPPIKYLRSSLIMHNASNLRIPELGTLEPNETITFEYMFASNPAAYWIYEYDSDIVSIDFSYFQSGYGNKIYIEEWLISAYITVTAPSEEGDFSTEIVFKQNADTGNEYGIMLYGTSGTPTPPPPPPPPAPVYLSYPEKYYKDITGDGNNDLIAISGEHCYVVPWKNGTYDYDSRQYMKAQYFTYPWKAFKDINNDGYLDFIGISGTHCYTVPANSSGKFDYNARRYMNQIYFDYPQKYIYDTNGDGYLDFVGISGVHQYNVPGDSSCLFDYNRRVYINHS